MIAGRRRLRLRREDGRIYLDRWGFETPLGGIYLHHITAPDPGFDLHDHPWWFASLIVRGGYTEAVADVREWDYYQGRSWRRWSVHSIRLGECHRIVDVDPGTWTLVLRGPRVRVWGFFTPAGWVRHDLYADDRRQLATDPV